MKRGVVKCLYDLAKHLTTKPSVISEEKKHLSSVSYGYPSSFVRKLAKTTRVTGSKEPAQEFKSTAVLPYTKGVSEVLCRCLQHQGIRTVFKSDTTLRSHLVRPKTIKTRRCRLQDPMQMRQSVHRWNWEINTRKDKRTCQRHTVCSYSDLCGFRAR